MTRLFSTFRPSAILYAFFMSFLCSNSMKAYPRGLPGCTHSGSQGGYLGPLPVGRLCAACTMYLSISHRASMG